MSLGLALAGGGLKGVAHIGALKALQELGIKNCSPYSVNPKLL